MKNSINFKDLYSQLNPQQKKAVDTLEGPVLVLAGPGTGKTQTLTMRVANILTQTDTPPDAILALTFTESGVRAMRERLVSIIGNSAYYTHIHTFHSFASEIIRSNPEEFITSSQLEPLSDLERVHIFKEILDSQNLKAIKPFSAPYFYLRTSIAKIKDLKREGISPEEYELLTKEGAEEMEEKDIFKNEELAKVYSEYQQKLEQHGRYDFEDMINFVTNRLNESSELLQKYQERFQYFLVDEFQDTNSAQAELLYKLASYWDPNPNLFVVGDDDQSIYRFQGASIENILTFNDKYPNAKVITLKTNYRSIQPIIDASQQVISNNTLRISNQLEINKAQKSNIKDKVDEQVVTQGEFSSSHTENYYIAKEIQKLLKDKVEPSEIAVIYRNNSDAIDIADMLARMQIQYTLEGGENVLETGIIIRLLHLLQVILKVRTKEEDLDMFTLLNYEFLNIHSLDILKLSRFASDKKLNFFEAVEHKDFDSLDIQDRDKIKKVFEQIITWNHLSANVTFVEFIDNVIEESGYLDWILQHDGSYEYLNKLNSFLSEIRRLNTTNKNLSLEQFLNYIDLMKEHNIRISEETIDIKANAVTLSTAHKSKGLEFEYVFITKCIDKKWSNVVMRDLIKLPPHILKTIDFAGDKEKKKHQEEDDRRLFYVVLTRAKKSIYITSAKHYQTALYDRSGIPSMFANEIPNENKNLIDVTKIERNTSQVLQQLLKPKRKDAVICDDEEMFLNHSLRNFKLSASSLNTYLQCPYKFKLQFLFRTPQIRTRPLVLGIAVHKSLEVFYREKEKGNEISLDLLLKSFETALSDEILKDIEFTEVLTEGKSILKAYYAVYEDELIMVSEKTVILERFLGWGFSKPLLDGKIHLQGKIDKLEVIDEQDKSVRIVDYKTGRPKSRNDILGKTKYSTGDQYRQLLFYKLLIDLDTTFDYTAEEVQLEFIGQRNNKPRREIFSIDQNDLETIKQTIRKVHKGILNLEFGRTTDYKHCSNCRFQNHCWPDGIPND